ncbi:hypothetical protein SMICM17S_12386 [Streptomyces microflavus]
MKADSGTICFLSVSLCQRRNMLAPPTSWNISSLKSCFSPAFRGIGALCCSLSQSGCQWSMTTLPSRKSRKPLSPMAEKVYEPVSGASSCPVQRAVVCSVFPVADSNVPVRPGKSISGSREVAPSSAKSRAPGADMLKYSPFSPCTSVTGSSAVKAVAVAGAGVAGAAAAVGTKVAPTGIRSAAAQVRALNRARGRGCCRLKASSSSKSREYLEPVRHCT